jgi:hypothetical protein
MGGSKWAGRVVLGIAGLGFCGAAFDPKLRDSIEGAIPAGLKPEPENFDVFNRSNKSYCDGKLLISKTLQAGDAIESLASWSGAQTSMVEVTIKTGPNGEMPTREEINLVLEEKKLTEKKIDTLTVDGALSEKDLLGVLEEFKKHGGHFTRIRLENLSLEKDFFSFIGKVDQRVEPVEGNSIPKNSSHGQLERHSGPFVTELYLTNCTLRSPDDLADLTSARLRALHVRGNPMPEVLSRCATITNLAVLTVQIHNKDIPDQLSKAINLFEQRGSDPLTLTLLPTESSSDLIIDEELKEKVKGWAAENESTLVLGKKDPESSTSQTEPGSTKLGLLGATSK